MGKSARDFFRSNGVKIVKKYHYCDSTPGLTTLYEPRNFVDEITFLRNTDTLFRYSLGNIQVGFSQDDIIQAVTGNGDLFTLGKLPFLFYNEKTRVTRERMKEYLDTIFKETYMHQRGGTIGAIDWIDFQRQNGKISSIRDPHSFISECENIRNVYRNPAAHSGIVGRNDAEVCYQRVIGRVDAYRHCSEV